MKQFPDQSAMERGDDGGAILGGSFGFNRILLGFVDAAGTDHKPRFDAFVINAFTIFRNNWDSKQHPTLMRFEEDFTKDIKLFLEYYDTYLSLVWNRLDEGKHCSVVIYFPDYHKIPKELWREQTGNAELLYKAWLKFSARYGQEDQKVQHLEHCRGYFIRAGDTALPHKDVARKVKDLVSHRDNLYVNGDPIGFISHIPLDWYLGYRLRNVKLVESNTARVRTVDEFRYRLDKEGRVPFQPAVHAVLGDGVLLQSQVDRKTRKLILDTAAQERWISRSHDDVLARVARLSGVSTSKLRHYDFG
jgi:hypothetical protein